MYVKAISTDDFNKFVEQKSGIQVFRFWATWCAPCRMMSPVYKQVAEAVGDKALFGEVNVDEYPEVAAIHKVRSIPAVVVYKDGEAVNGYVGLLQTKELQTMIEQYI